MFDMVVIVGRTDVLVDVPGLVTTFEGWEGFEDRAPLEVVSKECPKIDEVIGEFIRDDEADLGAGDEIKPLLSRVGAGGPLTAMIAFCDLMDWLSRLSASDLEAVAQLAFSFPPTTAPRNRL